MQKSSNLITDGQLVLPFKHRDITQLTHDNNDISFDKLLQKSEDDQYPNIDNVFNHIQIQQSKRSKSVLNFLTHKNTNHQRSKQNKSSTSAQINQMIQSSKLRMENKKLQHQMAKIKDKYQKMISNKSMGQKQQALKLNKQIQQLKLKLANSQLEVHNQKLSTKKIHQQLKQKNINADKQLNKYKEQVEYQTRQKQKTLEKINNMQKQMGQSEGKILQLQKNLRIKDKQLKKHETLQQQRNQYYQNTFIQKQNQIQKLKHQISKKSEQILLLNEQKAMISESLNNLTKQADLIQNDKNSVHKQIHQKNRIFQKICSFIQQGIQLIEQHLNRTISTKTMFPIRHQFISRRVNNSNFYNSQANYEYNSKHLIDLIMRIIQKNNQTVKQNQIQLQNFQQQYIKQLNDLQNKMNYLVEENKHLKLQKQNLRNQNKQLSRSIDEEYKMPFQQKNLINYKLQEQKLRRTIKQVRKQRQINTQQFKMFMNAENSYHSKIKQQIFDRQSARVKQQVEKARKIFNEVTLRSQSTSLMKERARQCSEPNLHKRSRKSLSWKKPNDVMKQYM